MNDVGSPISPRPWEYYTSSSSDQIDGYPDPGRTQTYKPEGPWKNYGPTPIHAISFGVVATAILISLFLVMAILEHLFRPTSTTLSSSSSSASSTNSDADNYNDQVGGNLELGLGSASKPRNQDVVMRSYTSGLTVVMPGQKVPTCIAQPAPLLPFLREGIHWPHHHR